MSPPNSQRTTKSELSMQTPSKVNPSPATFDPGSPVYHSYSPQTVLQSTNPSAFNPQVSASPRLQSPATVDVESTDTSYTLAESYYNEVNLFDYERRQTAFYHQYAEIASAREALEYHAAYQDMPKNPYPAMYPERYYMLPPMPVLAYQPFPGPVYPYNAGGQGVRLPPNPAMYEQYYYPQQQVYGLEAELAGGEEQYIADQENEYAGQENQIPGQEGNTDRIYKKKNKKKSKNRYYQKKKTAREARKETEKTPQLDDAQNARDPSSSYDVDQPHIKTEGA